MKDGWLFLHNALFVSGILAALIFADGWWKLVSILLFCAVLVRTKE